MAVVAVIGAATALMAGTIGLVQNDIKRVLAYSTVSQLGYMFLAKVGFILFAYIWVRWTVPRYRYDQLMQFGWKWLFPAAVLNLIATAAFILYFNA